MPKIKKDALKEAKELGLENLAALLESSLDDKEKEELAEEENKTADLDENKKEEPTVTLDSIFADVEGLPEGFADKAKVLFEAAVIEKARDLAKENLTALEESIKEIQEAKDKEEADQLDAYLSHVAESWYNENEVAITSNYKVALAEDFVAKITGLLQEYNVEIKPEEESIVQELEAELAKANESIDALVVDLAETIKEKDALKATAIIESATTGMTDVEKDRFTKVLGEMEYTNDEDFAKKVDVLKTVFTSKASVTEEDKTEENTNLGESAIDVPTNTDNNEPSKQLSEKMKSYVGALQEGVHRNKKK